MVLTLQVQTAEVSLMIFDFQTWGYLLSIAPFSTHRIESSVSQVKHSDIFLSELSQVNTVTYFCLMPGCFLSNIGGHLSCFAGQRKKEKEKKSKHDLVALTEGKVGYQTYQKREGEVHGWEL